MKEKVSAPVAPAPPHLPPPEDGHSSLMDAIRKGGSLRHVSEEQKSLPAMDTRCEMLDMIRQGVALKKVEVEEGESLPAEVSAPGIAGMLQRALLERGAAVGMSSSEESEGEDDEWDD